MLILGKDTLLTSNADIVATGSVTMLIDHIVTFSAGLGNVYISNVENRLSTIAVTSANKVNVVATNGINVNGISAIDAISVTTITGDILTASATNSAIILSAGMAELFGIAEGGNVIISKFGIIPIMTTSTGGRETFYTGSVSDSLGIAAMIGDGNSRYNSNDTIFNYTDTLSSGKFAIYRQLAPIVSSVSAEKIFSNISFARPPQVYEIKTYVSETARSGNSNSGLQYLLTAPSNVESTDHSSSSALSKEPSRSESNKDSSSQGDQIEQNVPETNDNSSADESLSYQLLDDQSSLIVQAFDVPIDVINKVTMQVDINGTYHGKSLLVNVDYDGAVFSGASTNNEAFPEWIQVDSVTGDYVANPPVTLKEIEVSIQAQLPSGKTINKKVRIIFSH